MGLVSGLMAAGLLLFGGLSTEARAQQDVEVKSAFKVAKGTRPALILVIHKSLTSAEVRLNGAGKKVRSTKGPAKPGTELKFVLPHDRVGHVKWRGSLAVIFADGSQGEMPLSFSTVVANPVMIQVPEKDFDLEKGQMVVTMNRPAKKVEIEVTGDDGTLIATQAAQFNGEPPGTPLTVKWLPRKDIPVLKVKVVGHDVEGFFSPAVELYPWKLEIPHEEVNFETGKSEIRASEAPKLKAVLPEMITKIKRYSKIVPVKVFIVGHTDTVGSSATNRSLSHARALSIARWFRSAGVRVAIYARGMGEDDLKVQTPDETDEEKNRRADYVLRSKSPTGSLSGWVKIR
jgi:outer membrane protein OmpA-like peptidoglycan-associated protein